MPRGFSPSFKLLGHWQRFVFKFQDAFGGLATTSAQAAGCYKRELAVLLQRFQQIGNRPSLNPNFRDGFEPGPLVFPLRLALEAPPAASVPGASL
jgi:hypothetical protein